MKDRKVRAVELFAMLFEAFGRQATEVTFLAYDMGLADVPIGNLEQACMLALRESKFMPTVSELRLMAATGTAATLDDLAAHAFSVVSAAVTRLSAYKSPNFSDPIINATVRALGGWVAICDRPSSTFDTLFRKDFIEQYRALHRTGVSEEAAAPLMGIFDQENGILGYGLHYQQRIECGVDAGTSRVRIGHKPMQASVPRLELKRTSDAD